MPVPVYMPQLGESVNEGTVTKWLKQIGERVEEYEALVEVNTDKVDTEIGSPAAGVLVEIHIQPGATVRAGTVLARIQTADESPAAAPPPHPEILAPAAKPAPLSSLAQAQGSQAAVSSGHNGKSGFISPVVAKIAREQGIDLHAVSGTGEGGRITKQDVLDYLAQRSTPIKQPAPAAQPVSAPQALEKQPPASIPGDEVLPLTPVRRAIAEHMVFSEHNSPHVTTVMEADLSHIQAHRQANKSALAREGINLTYTAYFMQAAASALKRFPLVNSSWSEQGILLHRAVHIGMATSLGEEGLIVPVIKHADSLSLTGVARAVNNLSNRARAHKLQPDEVKGGTFTITNHGTSGSLFATPIINQPQCAILGVGAIQKRVVVVGEDSIAIRPMVYLSLTFDHRILDGASADNFLATVVESLQNYPA